MVVYDKSDSGWWKGELNGNVGLFPRLYVQLIENLSQFKTTKSTPFIRQKQLECGFISSVASETPETVSSSSTSSASSSVSESPLIPSGPASSGPASPRAPLAAEHSESLTDSQPTTATVEEVSNLKQLIVSLTSKSRKLFQYNKQLKAQLENATFHIRSLESNSALKDKQILEMQLKQSTQRYSVTPAQLGDKLQLLKLEEELAAHDRRNQLFEKRQLEDASQIQLLRKQLADRDLDVAHLQDDLAERSRLLVILQDRLSLYESQHPNSTTSSSSSVSSSSSSLQVEQKDPKKEEGSTSSTVSSSAASSSSLAAGKGEDETKAGLNASESRGLLQEEAMEVLQMPIASGTETNLWKAVSTPRDSTRIFDKMGQRTPSSMVNFEVDTPNVPPPWLPDISAPVCYGCRSQFTMIRRRVRPFSFSFSFLFGS